MNLLELYQQKLVVGEMQQDPGQEKVIQQLQIISQQLMCSVPKLKFISALKSRWSRPAPIKGLYLWGGVGVGKTAIVDMFYHGLAIQDKIRIHFHAFMQYVHNELARLKGQKNPLQIVAKELRPNARLLCLDELIVNDIADAMLLAGLFKALYGLGCCIIFTSNVPPNELYKHGLQRQYFLPAIALIESHSEVLHLATKHDYRKRTTAQAGFYFTPLNINTEKQMQQKFAELIKNSPVQYEPLIIHGRTIPVVAATEHVVWFKFTDICHIPRSQKDFLTLVKKFKLFFISDIPVISIKQDNLIRTWINLIDVLYDHRIQLIVSAAQPPSELYTAGRLLFEYARTQSRLIEMQSYEYNQPRD